MHRDRALMRLARVNARDKLQSTNVQDPNSLGALTWNDPIPGWRKDSVSVTTEFRNHNLDPKVYLPPAPDYSSAFGRAVEAMKARLRKNDYTLIDAAKGAAGERRVGVVSIARNGRVETTDEGTIACPTSAQGGAPYVERADPNGYAADLLKLTNEYHDTYMSEDIQRCITQALERWYALPCRQMRPWIVWWVPPQAISELGRLSDVVRTIGWGEIQMFAGDARDPRSHSAITSAVNQGLESRINEFLAEAKSFQDKAGVRPSTLEARLTAVAELKDKRELYKTILGAAVVEIDAQYQLVEQSLRATLAQTLTKDE